MRKAAATLVGTFLVIAIGAGPALACGALVSPNGTIQLAKTTTLAAYVGGVEHYITGFEFQGGGAEFGSVIPLPDAPKRVIKAGDWTLQRLVQEVTPPAPTDFALEAPAADADGGGVDVLLRAQVDALDITVIEGGAFAVGKWVKKRGFALTPDAPEVLEYYASRSQVFAAVKFDPQRAKARGRTVGDSIPVHFVIPTDNPWVPLRILGLGAKRSDRIEADVFLLNREAPALLPAPQGTSELLPQATGLRLLRSEPASRFLLKDLRSDDRMGWMPPNNMWLTYLELNARAGDLTYDLAIDASGNAQPSPIDAGLIMPGQTTSPLFRPAPTWPLWAGAAVLAGIMALGWASRRSSTRVAV